ncbi:M1 family aminopeptidase [Nitritalea halalkaliphila]|uniref:M1 family aminopeptidase n=1 Tax=Nitritalea halalkaliphila TaxID=590849 RepID=UPI00031CCCC8|nr:M1 family aminopeptidase [Nitritalea halalkaliphila]
MLSFGIPNTFIIGVLTFALALTFRNNMVSYIGAMGLLVVYSIAGTFLADIEKEWLANLLDPFGFYPVGLANKYATVEELNTRAVLLKGDFLLNRLLWMGLAAAFLLLLYSRFSFETKKEKQKRKSKAARKADPQPQLTERPEVQLAPRSRFSWPVFGHLVAFELKAILKNQTFLIILIIGLINLSVGLTFFSGRYGSTNYPLTYDVIETISGAFYLFLIGIITFYSGVLVWRDRDAKLDEIKDATPIPTLSLLASKTVALLLSIQLILIATILIGIIAQSLYGYFHFELGVYFRLLLVNDFLFFFYLTVLAVFIHYLLDNRYIAYFVFVVFIVASGYVLELLEIESLMLNYGAVPGGAYSDVNGFGPWAKGAVWFQLYWAAFALLLLYVTYLLFIRGKNTHLSARQQEARIRLAASKRTGLLLLAAFLAIGGYVYYNTQVLNTYNTQQEVEDQRVAYEQTYKIYEDLAQPKWISMDYRIELYPEERDLTFDVYGVMENKTAAPISELHFTLPDAKGVFQLEIPGASLQLNDEALGYRIYTLAEALAPGETLEVKISGEKRTKGFENRVTNTSILRNGSFFYSLEMVPGFGYQASNELSDRNKRRKRGLPEKQRMPHLDEDNLEARNVHYIGKDSDWISVKAVIGTSANQIAISPGKRVREWEEKGRKYYAYEQEAPSVHFTSFLSADYEVARERWENVDIEVYHIPSHAYNIPNFVNAMKSSLDYYTNHFGPYEHSQLRIVEFPRYAGFAQSFPGTMPYSERIGFITDLRKVTEDDIDLVFYITAHETAHQYWAHQVIAANMRGAELLMEAITQYSALMVMEKEYGRDKMRKFLKYEMDGYLRGRGSEFEAERPLAETEQQGYIHYEKGSVVMYYLKEMIGEAQVNAALQQLIQEFKHQDPPYPTSMDAIRAFRTHTPDSLQYLIDDLFLSITLFSNRVLEASYQEDGEEYVVSFTTESKKFRSDSLGKETPIPLADFIDVGVFGFTDNKNLLGEPLVYERLKLTQEENSFTFRVREKPQFVGIDPYNYLIDRVPGDNVKKASPAED